MTKQHSKANLSGKTGQGGKSRKPSNKNTLRSSKPLNHNPLIAHNGIDTLANVYSVLQFLHDCDLLADHDENRFQPRAADGLHLIGNSVLQALRFEMDSYPKQVNR